MRALLKIPLILIAGGLLFLLPTGIFANIGQNAPDFTLKDSDGKSHSLKDYAGKVILLEFFGHT